MSKQHKVADAKAAMEYSAKLLKANEILWMDAWNAAPNPFVAIKNYRSEAQRSIRKPFIDAWLSAVAAYELVKPKTKAFE